MPPRYRADQIGSLLRPSELLEARASLASSSHMYDVSDDKSIKEAEKKAIQWAVAKQLELEIRPICSGEYNRHIFYGGFFEKLEGMTPMPDLPIVDAFRTNFPTTTKLAEMGAKTRAAVVCTGPIRWTSSAYMDEWKLLRSTLPRSQWSECKVTLPAPNYQHMQLKPGTAYTKDSGYSNDEAYFSDLAEAFVAEIKALYDEGCRDIQIDDPHLTFFCSSQFLEGCKKDGTDTGTLLDLYLQTHQKILQQRPGTDLHMGAHLCRGNMSGSTHFVSGSYDLIAKKLFTQSDFDTYYLEFDDTGRQGGFEPLRHLPAGKNVVLGLVSTKQSDLETIESIRAGAKHAANVIAEAQGINEQQAMDCLALSPQCGFSSSSLAGGKNMTMEDQWAKLALVRDAAMKIWGENR